MNMLEMIQTVVLVWQQCALCSNALSFKMFTRQHRPDFNVVRPEINWRGALHS